MADEPTHNPHGYAMAHGLAKVYLDAREVIHSAECRIEDVLYHSPLLAGKGWDYHGDPYDGSLELYVTGTDEDEALGAFVLSLGFARCWIHLHGTVADDHVCVFEDGEDMCSYKGHWRQRYYHRDPPKRPGATDAPPGEG